MSRIQTRPMSVGELLDRIFTLYRHQFPLFVGIMVPPSVLSSLFGLLMVGYGRLTPTGAQTPTGREIAIIAGFVLVILVFLVVNLIVGAAAAAATTLAVSEVNQERTTTIASCYRLIGGRFWSVLGVTVMLSIISLILLFCLVMMVAVLAAVLSLINPVLAALVSIPVAVLGIVGFVAWICRYAVAVPAIMIEKQQAMASLRRSSFLTQGFRFRVVLIALLMTLITYVAAFLFQGPFFLAATFLNEDLSPPLWTEVGQVVAGSVGGALTGPLLMIGLALLYFDVRVRKEAFDLSTLVETWEEPASPTGSA